METKTYSHYITVLRVERGDTFLRHVGVTNRRLITSDSSVRATGGSTVYQMNSRQVSKGNTVGTSVLYFR